MIIDLEVIYKKVIYVLVKKNHKVRLRKIEKETIVYDGSSVENGYDKIVELLKKTKRIKRTNMFGKLWQKSINFWRS